MENIKTLIEKFQKRGYTLEWLADKLEVSYMTIYRWANGKGTPHNLFIKEMKRLIGVIGEETNQDKNND